MLALSYMFRDFRSTLSTYGDTQPVDLTVQTLTIFLGKHVSNTGDLSSADVT